MAEHENRPRQDIGADEAYTINLKETIAAEKNNAGKDRLLFDAMATNMVVSMGAINQSIVRLCQSGSTASGKTAENIIGVNETDHVVRQIINSPWAEAMKTLMVAVMAERDAKKKE
jgi:hypothetical protein